MSALPATTPLSRGKIIAIASGKGGVGKTWFAITLAHAFARAGRRPLLLDGDLGLANVDVQLGLNPVHDLGGVLAGRVTLEAAAIAHPGAGFEVLAGRSGSGALAALDGAALDAVLTLLQRSAGAWDPVVVVLGAGVEAPQRRLAAAADTLLVVATEEPTSLTDAYAVLKLHARDAPGADARIIVNQATDAASGARTHATLARACETFLRRSIPLAGIVRRDPRVPEAIRRQAPLLTRHPNTAAAQDVEAIVRAL
jgi:flagellar biosynthesis protein FlhG